MKRLTKMSVAAYQRLAKHLDQRFSSDTAWDDLPLQRATLLANTPAEARRCGTSPDAPPQRSTTSSDGPSVIDILRQ